jgi:hypothetical protein
MRRQPGDEEVEKRPGDLRACGAVERRAVTFREVRQQGELADREGLAANRLTVVSSSPAEIPTSRR